ncbi:MAG: adenosylcobinamide-GDP ribazoletransferase [Candidatus Melainabacteria bacterium]|nr:adenosylcobinamide-GDP ribazoletransferase [Candidatus Melainabacteria bacterium]
MNPLKRFALAISYVTCLPLLRDPDGQLLPGLAKYLPAVGILLGCLMAGLAIALKAICSDSLVVGVILTLSWLIITGGIHFDGLMDTADGVFSHRERSRMLEIMADSRVGNFGVMVGFGIISTKIACLASLNSNILWLTLLVVPSWARWCETFTIGAFPYLREQGLGKVWHDTIGWPSDLIVSAIPPILLTIILSASGNLLSLLIALATILSGLACAFWLKSILWGHTGDTYGATVELAETGALLATALLVHLPH